MDGFAICHKGKCYVHYHDAFVSLFSCLRQDGSSVKICNWPFLASYVNALTSTICNMYGFTACLSLIRSKILPKNQALVNWFLTLKLTGITGIILYGPLVSIYMYCSNVKSCIRWYTSSHLAFLPLLSIVPALVMSSTLTYQPSVSGAVQAICMSKWYAWGLGNPIVNTRECQNN